MSTNNIAISVNNLSKVYRLYGRNRDRLKEALSPFRRKYHKDFYALKDVSFDVKKGETVGIIGKNGSGKSTLLKIITGVLTPTSGGTAFNGRISSLLELGAGFNPELTGVENIYFNGTIMGYSRKEMDAKFDSIIEFADIGDYIDQPMKTYSSGMFVRLAFATAINADPDILIIDEALSVGDMRFQQKCFRNLREFKNKGKTILFVTHDMGSIINFCDKAMWLIDGNIHKTGAPEDVCREYMSYMVYDLASTKGEIGPNALETQKTEGKDIVWEDLSAYQSFGEGGAVIKRIALYDKNTHEKLNVFEGKKEVVFSIEIQANTDILTPGIGILMNNAYGAPILGISNYLYNCQIPSLKQGDKIIVSYEFMFPNIKNGDYSFNVAVCDGTQDSNVQLHWVYDAYVIKILKSDKRNTLDFCLVLDDNDVAVNYEKIRSL